MDLQQSTLAQSLFAFLQTDQILDSDNDIRLYDTDATSLFKCKPLAVLLPNTAEEVAMIVRVINHHNRTTDSQISFVARGAGTGLSGGAIASPNSIIISLARLDKILEVDITQQRALIESGVVNQTLSESIVESGLHFAPDPSSQKSCTIGGNLAENAGGIHCYKYGVTVDHILGVEIVLPNGGIKYWGQLCPILQIHAQVENCNKPYKIIDQVSRGINLTRLVTGTEGTFGIVTKILVRLTERPKAFNTMQVCFATLAEATNLVAAIIRAGIEPAAMELIDEGAIEAVDAAYNLGFSAEVKAILLIELDGEESNIAEETKQVKNIIEVQSKPLMFEETQDPKRKAFLWKVRKGVAAAFGQIAPYWYLYDAVVPRSQIPKAMAEIEKIAAKHRLKLASIAHAADGNLHPNFLYDPDLDPSVVGRIHNASKEIMQLCVDLGGTLSGEHGIGVEKQEYMDYLFTQDDMDLMLRARKIFDPEMISNPNKLFPIRICKEHVACSPMQ